MDTCLYFFFSTEYSCLPGGSAVKFFVALSCVRMREQLIEGINANGLWEGVLSHLVESKTKCFVN